MCEKDPHKCKCPNHRPEAHKPDCVEWWSITEECICDRIPASITTEAEAS